MSKGPWLTNEQRAALIASYVEQGLDATKPLALSYGIKTRTIAVVARREGKRGKPRPKQVKVKRVRAIDRRWSWAIERGAITI